MSMVFLDEDKTTEEYRDKNVSMVCLAKKYPLIVGYITRFASYVAPRLGDGDDVDDMQMVGGTTVKVAIAVHTIRNVRSILSGLAVDQAKDNIPGALWTIDPNIGTFLTVTNLLYTFLPDCNTASEGRKCRGGS